MAPTGQAHIDIALAVLCTVGGVVGFLKKRSGSSLIAGGALGAAFATSAHLIQNVDAYQGHTLGASASAVLTLAMGSRFMKTHKAMPAGVLATIGLFGLVYHGFKMQDWE